jgi:hypothetical protein
MSKVVVGKMVMDGCPHCTNLQKPWTKLKTMLGGKAVFEEEIKSDGQNKLDDLNKKHGTDIKMALGFPSIFKITGGKVEYYEGERTVKKMADWILAKKEGNQTGGKRSGSKRSAKQSGGKQSGGKQSSSKRNAKRSDRKRSDSKRNSKTKKRSQRRM